QIGGDARVNSNGTAYYWVAFKALAGELKVGTYTGNGSDNRNITGIGFQPGAVIMMSGGSKSTVCRSANMSGDVCAQLDGAALGSNLVQALSADGFQVGTSSTVNSNGTVYHYIAWKATAGRVTTGSYSGNGTDNRNVLGSGFQPGYVIIKASTN